MYNISYYPDRCSLTGYRPLFRISDLLLSLRVHFSCVEPISDYALRFRMGNTQGILFDSGHAELVAPVQDAAVFSECAKKLMDLLYGREIKLHCFDAIIDGGSDYEALLGLYKEIARDSKMRWSISKAAGLRPLFSARPEEEEIDD